MRAVIQRVTAASVTIEGKLVSKIKDGLLVLLGIEEEDNKEDITWLSNKIINLRIFDDSNGVMNLSLSETGGGMIVVSQFTLHAKTKKGNRPSYIRSAHPDIAIPLYNEFISEAENILGRKIGTGQFGAKMEISLVNDGPVTIMLEKQ